MVAPDSTGFVQELLECDGLLVSDVINPSNVGLENGRFNGAQIVRRREQLVQRGFPPHAQKAAPREPPRGLDHQDPAPVDRAQPENDRVRGCASRALDKKPLFFEARTGMHGDRLAIEPPDRRLLDRRRTFYVGKRNQNDSADSSLESGRQQIRKPARIGLREKAGGTWSEEPAGEVDDHVGTFNCRRQRRRRCKIGLDRTNIRGLRHGVR